MIFTYIRFHLLKSGLEVHGQWRQLYASSQLWMWECAFGRTKHHPFTPLLKSELQIQFLKHWHSTRIPYQKLFSLVLTSLRSNWSVSRSTFWKTTEKCVFYYMRMPKQYHKRNINSVIFVNCRHWYHYQHFQHCQQCQNYQHFHNFQHCHYCQHCQIVKIVGPGHSLGGYILGYFQRLASCLWHSARIGPDLLCHPSSIMEKIGWWQTVTHRHHICIINSWFKVSFHGFSWF